MFIDTHCHLDFKDFDEDRDEIIARSKQEGIEYIINVGTSLDGTKKSIELAEKYDFIYAAAGIHPHDEDKIKDNDLEEFKTLLGHKKIVAIGEIGLDYYKEFSSKENQKKLFITLLAEARKHNLPVIIHNRDAHDDTIAILKEQMPLPVKGVFHCFSGNEGFLKKCMDMGMFVSFTCNLTFKNADRLREVAKLVPMDRFFLETDAPFLAPQAFRGRRNKPAYIKYLAEEISRLKSVTLEEAADITTRNAKRFFDIP